MSTDSTPIRHAARVVLMDEQNRTLLLRYDERGQRFWALPGGTLESGETHEQAARRELAEELGVADVEIGPQIATRDTGSTADRRVVEKYFTARVASAEVESGTPTQPDQIRGHRWWTLAALKATAEVVYPTALADLVTTLVDTRLPKAPVELDA